ncbi:MULTISPECIES: RNA recognition motif domain-containing protein [Alteromonadaceae]|uniref:RNA recognition motif domain-containing protein n=1 Tax=Alteromonadaceae TaxID=72275 RepID=UPI001C09306A|nr:MULTISPECIES: RNA-binding protein [Aliiglaciecola]MBU2877631.1 RNA-binding protein [Aliiglaciecola lipolytica]MDO6713164.1 RNA-binding protein [Aliiglaciecola sp. 2_MG-2023]MDO6754244.1 RNA-binding protein [Aliiglaciecola sp. 1_MG-2023]
MKSFSLLNTLFAIAFSIIAYFALPDDFTSVQLAFIFGLLFGAIAIPQFSKLISESKSVKSSAEDISSTTTLYVGNLPYKVDENAVSEHFSEFGTVASVRLMKDRRTGKRKGYGFVEVASSSADKMIKKLNDTDFQERTLKVRLAKDKTEG